MYVFNMNASRRIFLTLRHNWTPHKLFCIRREVHTVSPAIFAINCLPIHELKQRYSGHLLRKFPATRLEAKCIHQEHLHVPNVEKHDDHICIRNGDGKSRFPYYWLRDHCRCPECFHSETFQMLQEIVDLDLEMKPEAVEVTGDEIQLIWGDGHTSTFSFTWLQENQIGTLQQTSRRVSKRVLWQGRSFASSLPSYTFSELQNSSEGLKQALTSLYQYGMVAIQGVQSTVEESKEIVKWFGRAHNTFYGDGIFTFEANMENADTGYTNVALNLHTDGTYFNEPPGGLLFSCSSHDGTGGESAFTDGFNAADLLRQSDPDLFDVLCKTPVLGQSVDNERIIQRLLPTIMLNQYTDDVELVRYNSYDRAVVSYISYEDVKKFYKAYQAFTRLLFAPENEFKIKLNPGTTMIIDNWRVLHGRTAFTGRRVMCFAYLARDDLLSQYRVTAGIPIHGV